MAKPLYITEDIFQKDGKKISSQNFTSGSLGSGWLINENGNTSIEIDNLLVRNTLRTHIFQKDVIKATNGQLYVADSAVISSSDTGTTGTIYFKEDESASFSGGEELKIKDWDDDGTIQTITFTINSPGATVNGAKAYTYKNGVNMASIVSGMTAVKISGGRVLIDASTTDGPFIDIFDASSRKARLGNLSGIAGASGYGLWSENVFLSGTINADYGKIAEWDINGNKLEAGNIILDSTAGSEKISITGTDSSIILNQDGSATIGDLSISDTGNLTASQFSIIDGAATFSGELSAAKGTFGTVAANKGNVLLGETDPLIVRVNTTELMKVTEAGVMTVGGWTIGNNTISSGNISLNSNTDVVQLGTNNTFNNDGTFSLAGESVTWNGETLSVNGDITATDGSLSNMDISGTLAIGTNGKITLGDIIINNNSITSANFSLTGTGTITANDGEIGGWNIGTSTLSSTGITLTSSDTAANNKIEIGNSAVFRGDGTFTLGDISSSKYLNWDNNSFEIKGDLKIGNSIGDLTITTGTRDLTEYFSINLISEGAIGTSIRIYVKAESTGATVYNSYSSPTARGTYKAGTWADLSAFASHIFSTYSSGMYYTEQISGFGYWIASISINYDYTYYYQIDSNTGTWTQFSDSFSASNANGWNIDFEKIRGLSSLTSSDYIDFEYEEKDDVYSILNYLIGKDETQLSFTDLYIDDIKLNETTRDIIFSWNKAVDDKVINLDDHYVGTESLVSGALSLNISSFLSGSGQTTNNFTVGGGLYPNGGISSDSGAVSFIGLDAVNLQDAILTSTVATGTAPFIVSSTTEVTNLNAEKAGWADQVDVNSSHTGPGEYEILWHSGDTVYATTGITINRDSKSITATEFIGSLTGTADAANTIKVNNYDGTTNMRILGSHQTGGSDSVYSTAGVYIEMDNDVVFASGFNGNLTGNVTGNLTGDVTGTASGNLVASDLNGYYNSASDLPYPSSTTKGGIRANFNSTTGILDIWLS